jgi:hypothetical protein
VTLTHALPAASDPSSVFMFSNAFANTGSQQLQTIDVTSLAFNGIGIKLSVKRAGAGDGLANLGYINSTNFDLGAISVQGDLGRIDAGNVGTSAPALKSISVQSIGQFGITTQASGGTLDSNITGALGPFAVKSDIIGAWIQVTGGAAGKIKSVTVGGSLLSLDADHTGEISATGNIGTVRIGGDIVGGDGNSTGLIQTSGNQSLSVRSQHSTFRRNLEPKLRQDPRLTVIQ